MCCHYSCLELGWRELQNAQPFPATAAPGNPTFVRTQADQQAYEIQQDEMRRAAQEAACAMICDMDRAGQIGRNFMQEPWFQPGQLMDMPKGKGL